METRILNHLIAALGAILSIAGIIALATSHSVKSWARSNGILLFVVLIAFVIIAFITIDYLLHRQPPGPSAHDKKIFRRIYSLMRPDGDVVALLKLETIWNGYSFKVLSKLDEATHQIDIDEVGMDNRYAETAYRQLQAILGEFRHFQAMNTFPDLHNRELAVLSDQWDHKTRKEAADKIDDLASAAGVAYDNFLKICHKHGIDGD